MVAFYQLDATISHGGIDMAKIKSSIRGKQNKKIVPVRGYKRVDGTKVAPHRRSTPN